MELSEVKQVVEVVGDRSVNAYLELGWVLITTARESEGDRSWICYSLGWPRELPAQTPNFY
jgi:hypothetical protein